MKEIDIRALIYGNLKSTTNGMATIKSLTENQAIVDRKFNENYEWNTTKATNYIESVMLNIEMHEIVLFKYHDDYYICNGLNRIKTLRKFINNNLKLKIKGLEKYKNLAEMKFEDLSSEYQEKFLNNIYLRTIIYEYIDNNNRNHELTEEEALEIQKYLYHIYNNCIKLEITEIQKAEYSDEYINNYFKSQMIENSKLLEKLNSLYFCTAKNKRQKIDSILVNIRSFLCLTYNPINKIKKYYTTRERINNLYRTSQEELNHDNVIRDFLISIDFLYNMQQLKIWKQSEDLHNKYFIETIYWLISVIKKDNLLTITNVPIESIIEAANNNKELFTSSTRFSKNEFTKRFEFIKEYAEKYLGLDLSKYIEGDKEQLEKDKQIEIPKQDYSFTPLPSNTIKLSAFLNELKQGAYDLFPKIQRGEVMDKKAASEIIQTILLGIKIPPILIYEKNENGKIIKSITDGKQRILALIAFLGVEFKNISGETCISKKNNFGLQDLKIMSELNGKTFNGTHKKPMLEENLKKKILDYDLDIVVVNQQEASNFSEKEHFVRLNGSFKKKNIFCIWRSIFDTKILDEIIKVSQKHKNKIFCKNDNDNNGVVVRLAYLENTRKKEKILKTKISNTEINSWLSKIENAKVPYIRKNDDSQIIKLKNEYLSDLQEMNSKLSNIENWLFENKLDIYKIFNLKQKKTKFKQFICLYQLLGDISFDVLYLKTEEILEILTSFYKEIKNNLDQKELVDTLSYYKTKIDILDDNHRIDSNLYVAKMKKSEI